MNKIIVLSFLVLSASGVNAIELDKSKPSTKEPESVTVLTEKDAATAKKHAEITRSQNGEMTFWSDSITLPNLFQLIADFAEMDLRLESSISEVVAVKYMQKTHWKTIVADLAKQHQLKVSYDDNTISVKR